MVSRACLREQISEGRKQPMILNVDIATPCIPPR
jgi:hypothetical protein